MTLRFTSGWDHALIADTEIAINGATYQTNGDGIVNAVFPVGAPIDVRVPNYLPRTVRAGADPIALWPIAGTAEADALQSMLYEWFDELMPLSHAVSTLDVQFDPALSAQVSSATLESVWRAAGDEIAELTENRIRFVPVDAGAKGHLQIAVRACGALTICFRLGPYGFDQTVSDRLNFDIGLGSADAALRPDVALRASVLAAIEFKSGSPFPSPLPGLLHDGSALTDFERRLIRLASSRKSGNRWPDRDPF